MRLLIDTHGFLFYVSGDPQLTRRARTAIEDRTNDRFFSMASVWETAIKDSLGKLNLMRPFTEIFPHWLTANGIQILDIHLDHLVALRTLPHHHHDPFDRLIVAQTFTEGLALVSGDAMLDRYGVTRLW